MPIYGKSDNMAAKMATTITLTSSFLLLICQWFYKIKIDIDIHHALHTVNHLTAISKKNMNFLILYKVLKFLLLLFQASFSYVHNMYTIMEKVCYMYTSDFPLM